MRDFPSRPWRSAAGLAFAWVLFTRRPRSFSGSARPPRHITSNHDQIQNPTPQNAPCMGRRRGPWSPEAMPHQNFCPTKNRIRSGIIDDQQVPASDLFQRHSLLGACSCGAFQGSIIGLQHGAEKPQPLLRPAIAERAAHPHPLCIDNVCSSARPGRQVRYKCRSPLCRLFPTWLFLS